jgi:hypothetical protein
MAEQDKKYVGVVLRTHDEAGIARITIINVSAATTVLNTTDIDLYDKNFDRSAIPNQYKLWCFWWKVEPASDIYSIHIELSPNTITGRYLEIEYYLENIPILDGYVTTTMRTWHEDFEFDTYTYSLAEDTVTSLEQTYSIDADGSTTIFSLPSTVHAHDFKLFKTSTGDTWKYPTSIDITWGTSGSNYENETIDPNGNFGIKFYTAPPVGSTITFTYIPKVNKYVLRRVMKQPYLESYKDNRREVRLLDDSIELIP